MRVARKIRQRWATIIRAMDVSSIAPAFITSSIVSTAVVGVSGILIQRRVDMEIAAHVETLRAAQARELAQLKLDYDEQLEQFRGSIAVAGSFEQALMDDRVTLYRSMATVLYELKLSLDKPLNGRKLDAFAKGVQDLSQLMLTNRFFLQRDDVFRELHALKHETYSLLVFANGRQRGRGENDELGEAMRRKLVSALDEFQTVVARVLDEPSRS